MYWPFPRSKDWCTCHCHRIPRRLLGNNHHSRNSTGQQPHSNTSIARWNLQLETGYNSTCRRRNIHRNPQYDRRSSAAHNHILYLMSFESRDTYRFACHNRAPKVQYNVPGEGVLPLICRSGCEWLERSEKPRPVRRQGQIWTRSVALALAMFLQRELDKNFVEPNDVGDYVCINWTTSRGRGGRVRFDKLGGRHCHVQLGLGTDKGDGRGR